MAASFSLAPLAILFVVCPSVIYFAREIFSPSIATIRAVGRVIVVLTLITLAFGQVYYLLPQSAFSPAFLRSWSGVLDAGYYSFMTMATLSAGTREPVQWSGKVAQVLQVSVSLIVLGFGINYVLESHRPSGSQ